MFNKSQKIAFLKWKNKQKNPKLESPKGKLQVDSGSSCLQNAFFSFAIWIISSLRVNLKHLCGLPNQLSHISYFWSSPFYDYLPCTHLFIYKQHFYEQRQAEIAKNQAKAEQHPEAERLLFEKYSLSASILSSKTNLGYFKKCSKKCLLSWDYVINCKKNEAGDEKGIRHRYVINRTRPRHGQKCTICPIMMMVMCNKQHPSNIWGWIREKVKQHRLSWKKKMFLIKKASSGWKMLHIVNLIEHNQYP